MAKLIYISKSSAKIRRGIHGLSGTNAFQPQKLAAGSLHSDLITFKVMKKKILSCLEAIIHKNE